MSLTLRSVHPNIINRRVCWRAQVRSLSVHVGNCSPAELLVRMVDDDRG